MRRLSKRQSSTPDQRQGTGRLLKLGIGLIASALSFYLLLPSPYERERKALASSGERHVRPVSQETPPARKQIPSATRARSEMRRLMGAHSVPKHDLVTRMESEFTYDGLDCAFVPLSEDTRLPQLPGLRQMRDDPMVIGINGLRGSHDTPALISTVNYLDSLNMPGLLHHYVDQHRQAKAGEPVPEPGCVWGARRALASLVSAQIALENLIIDGYAELEHVLPLLSPRQKSEFISSFAGRFLFDNILVGGEGMDVFERHFLSLPEPEKGLLADELRKLVPQLPPHHRASLDRSIANSDGLAPETVELLFGLRGISHRQPL